MKKLKLVGYMQTDEDNYRSIEFEVVESALYAVDTHFPRLTPASFVGGLPASVTRVNYTINLDGSKAEPYGQSAADSILDSVIQRA
jgi:hypothetical protein